MAGETTSVAVSASRQFKQNPGFGSFMAEFDLTFGATDNETADVMQAGYLGPGVTVYGVIWQPTDMDTNVSPAVVHKVTVGSTDVATGLTGAQTGATQIVGCSAFVSTGNTARTLVSVTSSTAAATAAAGTAKLVLMCMQG